MADRLTLKQERFIHAYLGEAHGNATMAARIAGYAQPEASAKDLLPNPTIRARIDERLLAESMSSAEVLAELTTVARADWRDFLQVRTNPATGEVVEAKIVLGDKVKALELLGKYHKLFTDKTELSGDESFLSALRDAGASRPATTRGIAPHPD